MEILFCDLCNESVPQSDLDKGLAFRRGTRTICQACERSMSEEPGSASTSESPAQPAGAAAWGGGVAVAERVSAPRRTQGADKGPQREGPGPATDGTAGVLLAIVALLFSVGATALVVDRIDEAVARYETAQVSTRADFARLQEGFSALEARVAGMIEESESRSADQREQRLTTFAGELEGTRERVSGLQAEVESLGSRFDGDLADRKRAEAESTQRLDGLSSRLAGLDEATSFHKSKMIELEERVHAITQGGGLFAAAQAPQAGGAPTWQPLLPDLSNAQPPIRLEAIYALGETNDKAVVPYIVPMLQDVDLFVRMAAARVLEDLEARSAVPALIDALEDPEPPVTESAMFALRKITGKSFDFEPNESASERARKIKLWRSWWDDEGEAFLAGS